MTRAWPGSCLERARLVTISCVSAEAREIAAGRASQDATPLYIAPNGTTTSYDDNAVSNGTTYYYEVTAVNSVGESNNSNEVSATPSAGTTAPDPPTNLKAVIANGRGIQVSWTAPAGTVNSYNVYRTGATSAACGGSFTKIASPTSTSYKDTSAGRGSYYCYYATAVNSGGESLPSNTSSPAQAK
jgi:fibronectin type 3 domain-containing protein